MPLPSQGAQDFNLFHTHRVDLVFLCELHEDHHNRAALPPDWRRFGADESQLAMAPGWTIHDYGLRRVWPDDPENHLTKGWRLYFQAGGSTGSSSRQQEAAGGSWRQQEAASSVSSKQRVLAGR